MPLAPCTLRGITWDHSRAFPPLVATAQRFEELNPGVRIVWEKRSLHAFGHANVAELARSFDLVIMDHPWCGFAVDENVFIDLMPRVSDAVVADLRANSVGGSFESYVYGGQLIALPVDAATPVATYRPDLLPAGDVPQTWNELMDLAKGGRVAASGFHVDLMLHLVMLVATVDRHAFSLPDAWASRDVIERAMTMLGDLFRLLPLACFELNPIAVYECMTRTDEIAYCPFAYSYSNYMRPGFARRPLVGTDLVSIGQAGRLRSVLGGTGVALSNKCENVEQALAYMAFTASADVQRGIYLEAGGQSAHRAAWTAGVSGNFFADTLAATDRAYVRPRYNGFLHFQETAGRPLTEWVRQGGPPGPTIDRMNELYRESRRRGASQEN